MVVGEGLETVGKGVVWLRRGAELLRNFCVCVCMRDMGLNYNIL